MLPICKMTGKRAENSMEIRAYIKARSLLGLNPLPDWPILGSSNSTSNKDMMSKIWINWDTVI